MNFLLIGSAEDPHISETASELRAADHDVLTWCTSEVPAHRVPIMRPGGRRVLFELPERQFSPDLVWLRKRAKPDLGVDDFGEEREFLEVECTSFIDGVLMTLEQACPMINRASRVRRAASKLLQLDAVSKMGFRTPRTLSTSDPQSLQTFWREVGEAVVFKPMARSYVTLKPVQKVLPTTLLEAEHVFDDDLVRGMPGLYQELIRKIAEVRVTIFGNDIVAAKLCGPSEDEVDWRSHFATREVIPCELPALVQQVCRDLLKFFEIEYATFDFAIDTDGDWVFLEMNEAGNFIFMHHRLPDLRILERFSKFLVNRPLRSSAE